MRAKCHIARELHFAKWLIGADSIRRKAIEYDVDKLAVHQVADWEAAEVLWNGFAVRPNAGKHGPDRYQILGRTDAGRPLKLIVHVSGERTMRVITGWRI